MADANFSTKGLTNTHPNGDFNINLGRDLFSDPQRSRHNAIVVSNCSSFQEGIDNGDLVEIDFTVNHIRCDNLYVITLNDEWIGYRRFTFFPKLHILNSDGKTEVTPEILKTIKVVGEVKGIYKKVGR